MYRVLFYALLVIWALAGGLWVLYTLNLSLRSESVEGWLERAEEHQHTDSDGNPDTSYALYYAFEHDGRMHEVKAFWNRGENSVPPLGTRATILVPPGGPRRAVVGGMDLWTCPAACGVTAFAPLGLWLLLVGMVKTNPEGLAGALGGMAPEVSGLLRDQVLLASLKKRADATVVRATIVSVSEETPGNWVILAEGGDRVYASNPLPGDLGPHLADREVDIYVDPDDPERYAIDFHDLLMEAAGKTGRST
ncbi:MAG: hypothetical protein H6736_05275 [Alphaproteobacteria bacterium]|nr:hypothetical protein [Alphaproteobacteria bacterium]MCB9691209.1 hypothetical protein [Alphaproteobacteria bacterium]